MNFSSILGLAVALVVFTGGVVTSTSNWKIYLNSHAFFIVFGGTLAATLVSFPLPHLIKISKIFIKKILGQNAAPHLRVIEEIVQLSQGLQSNEEFLRLNQESIKNPFLKEAVQLQIEGGIANSKIDEILRKRAEVHFVRYEEEAHMFKTVARFPPAFGLLGAVLGMIALMTGLGSPDSFKQIGPAMAMAMVATMYGIALANFIFIPLGENLSKLNKEDHLMRNIVIDGLKLLRDREHPIVAEEHLKSYLLTTERRKLSTPRSAA